MDTASIISWGGIFIILALIFAETGLLLGLVLPGGETLVFTAGLLVSTRTLDASIYGLLPAMVLVAIMGDISGYFIGKRLGKQLYNKRDSWYFKKEYLLMAEDFLKKHKRRSMILGKFLPVVRPFMPLMWGIARQKFQIMVSLSFIASIIYMSVFCLGGFFLGESFPSLKNYIHWILPVSIILSLFALYRQVRKYKREHRTE